MNELRELYQEVIIDHGRHPRNQGHIATPTHTKEGFNPLCGDRLTIDLIIENDRVKEIKFIGTGCAISMASASLMSQAIEGKTLSEVQSMFEAFHALLTDEKSISDETLLGKTHILAGVREFPARVKCATLSWHTLMAAIHRDPVLVSTE